MLVCWVATTTESYKKKLININYEKYVYVLREFFPKKVTGKQTFQKKIKVYGLS
jgi:hypothetical protein